MVIPAHNEEALLPQTLGALLRQTRPADELIVVDSASTDRTANVAMHLGAKVVYCGQPGVAIARQAGLEAASGSWVVTTDADSLPEPTWLAELELAMPGAVALYGPMRFFGLSRFEESFSELGYRVFLALGRLIGKPNLAGANMAFKREAALLLGGYPGVEAREDVLLGLALQRLGQVRYVPNALVRTSARKLSKGWTPFLWKHIKNFFEGSDNYLQGGSGKER